jgi:eukaryotic-like serine/threonine-protein kinase
VDTVSIRPKTRRKDDPGPFLLALRDSGLLSDEQLGHVKRQLASADVRTVAGLLLDQGWLNEYQLTRVATGDARGLVLGQYRVLDELGEGGFGKVYKAVHRIMNRAAAVKVISPKWAVGPDGRKLFLREVLAATRLAHPNIALVYEAGETDGALWFAMEFVDGPTLQSHVAAHGPLAVPFACAVVQQVARALQCAHEHGLVHRDVKPANLLLPRAAPGAAEAVVKVVDFGLARLAAPGASGGLTLCGDGECVGTPEYMSPEQARDSHKVDIRSDLYSLGCTFYFALAGRSPFQGATALETVTRHWEEEEAPLATLRPDVPPGVADVVRRLMAKDPARRFADPADLIASLCVAVAGPRRGLAAAPSAPPPPAAAPVEAAAPAAETAPRAPAAPPADSTPALWREWLGLVGALARREACDWTEPEYSTLYDTLRAALRAGSATGSPQGLLFARLESFVEPWVKLRALNCLDGATLDGLWQSGRRLDAELSPARRGPHKVWAALAGLAIGLVGLLAAYWLLRGR